MNSEERGFEQSLPIALLRARETVMRKFRPVVDAHGLTLPQWRVIRALADEGALDASALCDRCVILAPSLTRIMKTLKSNGLIDAENASDARRRVITLTDSGRRVFEAVTKDASGIYDEIEDRFGEANMAELIRLLRELRDAVDPI